MKCEGPAAVVAEGGPGREEGTSHARRPLRERELLCGQVGRELSPCLPQYPSWERHVPCVSPFLCSLCFPHIPVIPLPFVFSPHASTSLSPDSALTTHPFLSLRKQLWLRERPSEPKTAWVQIRTLQFTVWGMWDKSLNLSGLLPLHL